MLKKFVLFIFILLMVCPAYIYAEDTIKLKFANYFPPFHTNSTLMDEFCKEVTEKSGGKLEIKQYSGSTLLEAPKMAAGIASGIADIGLAHVNYTRGRFPVMEIVGIPLGFPSPWVGTHCINDFYSKFKPKEWDDYHVLMFSTSPPNVLQTLTKPVKTLKELQGLKIRGTGRIADIIKALGGTPMPIPMPDMYDSLRRGVIDGNYGNFEQMKGWKTGELLKYTTSSLKASSMDCFYVIMNKDKWNSLPADMKKLLINISDEYVEKWARAWNQMEVDGKAFFIDQGGKLLELSNSEHNRWEKAVQSVIVDYRKDLVSKGYKASEVNSWVKYLKQRMSYWMRQEKARKVPTAYKY